MNWLSVRTVVLSAVLMLACAVGVASYAQRSASQTGARQVAAAQALLTSVLDQETGVRGFAIAGREAFLDPYRRGRRTYIAALRVARRGAAGDPAAQRALEASHDAAYRWGELAREEIVLLRAGDRDKALSFSAMQGRKSLMDAFRASNRTLSRLSTRRSTQLETRAVILSVLLVILLGAGFSAAGVFVSRRAEAFGAARRRRLDGYEHRQRDLNLGLQVTESETEAHTFLQRHLEQVIPASEVVVLTRNNSANRLRPGLGLHPGSKLAGAFEETEPRSCLAIRLAQPRTQSASGSDSVLACEICGKLETRTTCSPLLAGGAVIGAVLVGHAEPLDDLGTRAIDESVKQAAPVLANLRNLAIAQTRAATDGLTGLANRRTFDESLKRMVAQANRSASPLAAVALDLDHFKQINDIHGHARGDEVLAEVGALFKSLLRESDFVARVGGEEFMMLLPDTDRAGALVIADRIRASIEALEFPALDRSVTASLGLAVLPDDAVEGAALTRLADRMLYAARENGRNRVEITDLAAQGA